MLIDTSSYADRVTITTTSQPLQVRIARAMERSEHKFHVDINKNNMTIMHRCQGEPLIRQEIGQILSLIAQAQLAY